MRKLGVTLQFYNIIFTLERKPMMGNGGFEQKGSYIIYKRLYGKVNSAL